MAYRSSTYRTGSSTATPAYAVPAGAAAGDIAVVGMFTQNSDAITPPSGFIQKFDSGSSAAIRLVIFWKRLTGPDSGAYDFTLTSAAWNEGVCSLLSGRVGTGDPFTATSSAASDSATSLVVPGITATASDDLVGVGICFNGGAWTPPAGMVERQDTGAEVTLDTADAVTAGATGDKTFTYAGSASGMKAFLGALATEAPPASGGSVNTRTMTYHINRKAGTLVNDLPTLEATGAANVWAGTTGLALVGALNVVAGNTLPNYRELAGVLNQLAGTSGLGVDEAASRIA